MNARHDPPLLVQGSACSATGEFNQPKVPPSDKLDQSTRYWRITVALQLLLWRSGGNVDVAVVPDQGPIVREGTLLRRRRRRKCPTFLTLGYTRQERTQSSAGWHWLLEGSGNFWTLNSDRTKCQETEES